MPHPIRAHHTSRSFPKSPTTTPHGQWSYLFGKVFCRSLLVGCIFCKWENRGDRNRTGDLLCIRQALYQLSYTPITAFQRLALVFIVPCVTLSGLFCLCCYPDSEGSLHFSAFALDIRPACRITHQLWSTSGVKELNPPFLTPEAIPLNDFYLSGIISLRMSVSTIETYTGTTQLLKKELFSAPQPMRKLWVCGFAPHMKPGT